MVQLCKREARHRGFEGNGKRNEDATGFPGMKSGGNGAALVQTSSTTCYIDILSFNRPCLIMSNLQFGVFPMEERDML